jgi:single-strand DNA-binding protein
MMFDTYVTVVGNALTAPEWRRTTGSQALVANFKVASTSRRYDKDSGRWVDGDSLRVRVTCWRRLAEGVASSVMVGDPLVVTGRMYTRDWTTEDGQRRVSYELEAAAVGHDLSRGRAKFLRNRASTATHVVEDDESDTRIGGEPSEPVHGGDETGAHLREDAAAYPGEDAAAFEGLDPGMFTDFEPVQFAADSTDPVDDEELDDSDDAAAPPEDEKVDGASSGGRRARKRTTVTA